MLIQHTAPAECKDLVQIAWRFSNGEETALVWWRWTLVGVCQTKPKAVDCWNFFIEAAFVRLRILPHTGGVEQKLSALL